jgi:hypothetical protein
MANQLYEPIINNAIAEFKTLFASQDEDGNAVEIDNDYINSFKTIILTVINSVKEIHVKSENTDNDPELTTILQKLKETSNTSGPKKCLTAYQAYQQSYSGKYSEMIPWGKVSEEEKKKWQAVADEKNKLEGRVSSKGTTRKSNTYREFMILLGTFNEKLPSTVKPKPSGTTIKNLGLYSPDLSLKELREKLVTYYNQTYNLALE